jgi:hypothetical protein
MILKIFYLETLKFKVLSKNRLFAGCF